MRYLLFIVILAMMAGCKKFSELTPPATSVTAANVYASDATAISAVTGIYTTICNTNWDLRTPSLTSIPLFTSLYTDELTLYNLSDQNLYPFYSNSLTSQSSSSDIWTSIYSLIFLCNSAIEGITSSNTLTPAVKQQLLGEAKFMRAFCNFYLVNLYGPVPLPMSSDFKKNQTLSRSPETEVYNFMEAELIDAENLLSGDYLDKNLLKTTSERVRPTKAAAAGLLARVYLYVGDWANAETESSRVINDSLYYKLADLNSVFLKNSSEAIWQLQPVGSGGSQFMTANTGDAAMYILPATGPNTSPNEVFLDSTLLKSVESNDQRQARWIGSVKIGNITYYYPYKYKAGPVLTAASEYIMILRLAEQYLIRSEARAQLGNIPGAKADLNSIRSRAGLTNTPANDKQSLLNAILHERQLELFTEWGNRFFDLKRTSSIDSVMTSVAPRKGTTWDKNKAVFPIPYSEILLDNNLTQNDGY
jgi:hypothetical protein